MGLIDFWERRKNGSEEERIHEWRFEGEEFFVGFPKGFPKFIAES